MDWKNATASVTVTMLMTMLAESVEDIRIFRGRPRFMFRKDQIGSALKSTSATQSAITANGEHQQGANGCLVLTGGLGYEDRPRHATFICNASLNPLSEHHNPHDPEKDTNAEDNVSQSALGMRNVHHGG